MLQATMILGLFMAAPGADEKALSSASLESIDLSQVKISLSVVEGQVLLPRLPVLLQVKIQNTSSKVVIVPRPTFSSRQNTPNNTLDIYYTTDRRPTNMKRIRYLMPDFSPYKENAEPAAPTLLHLSPDEAWSTQVPLSYDWNIDLPRAIVDTGNLTLQARLCSIVRETDQKWQVRRGEGANSNRCVLSIMEPQGLEQRAYRALMKQPRIWLLAAPNALDYVPDDGFMSLCQKLNLKFPESTYALYANAAMAHMFAAGSLCPLHEHRTPDYRHARRLMQKVRKDQRFVLSSDLDALQSRIEQLEKGIAQSRAKKGSPKRASHGE